MAGNDSHTKVQFVYILYIPLEGIRTLVHKCKGLRKSSTFMWYSLQSTGFTLRYVPEERLNPLIISPATSAPTRCCRSQSRQVEGASNNMTACAVLTWRPAVQVRPPRPSSINLPNITHGLLSAIPLRGVGRTS